MDPQNITLNLLKDPISKILSSDYIAINPSNSWKVASQFDIEDDLDIVVIHPRTESTNPVARWKWAHWDDTYEVFFEITGGRPPYRYSVIRGPSNFYLGATGTSKSQVFNFIPDPDMAGMFTLDMPDDFGLMRITPTTEQQGQTFSITIRVEDMAGRVVDHTFPFSVDAPASPKFRYASESAGNNANAGTRAAPFQTWQHIYAQADAGNFIHVFENGTYTINNGTSGQNAAMGPSNPRSIVGRGAGTILNMNTGHFSGSGTDVYVDNVTISGGRATDSNVRIFNWTTRLDRLFYSRIFARNLPLGTLSVQDNPTLLFITDNTLWANRSRYIGMRNIDFDTSCKIAACILFSCEDVIIRKCNGVLNYDAHIPLGKPVTSIFIVMKDSITNGEISYCKVSGYTDNSFINWNNQSPENCTKQRTRFCSLDYTGNSFFAPLSCNAQAAAVDSRSTDSRIERCSVKAGTCPVIATYGGVGGEPVKVSGLIYSTTGALFSTPSNAVAVGAGNVQINANQFDANMNLVAAIKAENLGIRGGQMATTMVT